MHEEVVKKSFATQNRLANWILELQKTDTKIISIIVNKETDFDRFWIEAKLRF